MPSVNYSDGPRQLLLQVALRKGIGLRHLCGGHGQCGTCRVRVLAGKGVLSRANARELRRLPHERLEEGWRLSCQARLLAPGEVEFEKPLV